MRHFVLHDALPSRGSTKWSSQLFILNLSASTSFSKEGVAMVGVCNPMSSAAVSKALCNTRSCWCFVARARASQTGERFFESVTCTSFSRCKRFARNYSSAPLFYFLSRTPWFSSRVSLSSTATSPTILSMQVPSAWLMLRSRLGRWLMSSWWWCWRSSAFARGADGSGTMSAECVWAGSDDRIVQPVNDTSIDSLGRSVENFSPKSVPSLYRGKVLTQQ